MFWSKNNHNNFVKVIQNNNKPKIYLKYIFLMKLLLSKNTFSRNMTQKWLRNTNL